jgi:hypothetical protein
MFLWTIIRTDKYISSRGTDINPCTMNEPCKTIQETVIKSEKNETIYLLEDYYDTPERKEVIITKSIKIKPLKENKTLKNIHFYIHESSLNFTIENLKIINMGSIIITSHLVKEVNIFIKKSNLFSLETLIDYAGENGRVIIENSELNNHIFLQTKSTGKESEIIIQNSFLNISNSKPFEITNSNIEIYNLTIIMDSFQKEIIMEKHKNQNCTGQLKFDLEKTPTTTQCEDCRSKNTVVYISMIIMNIISAPLSLVLVVWLAQIISIYSFKIFLLVIDYTIYLLITKLFYVNNMSFVRIFLVNIMGENCFDIKDILTFYFMSFLIIINVYLIILYFFQN